MDNEEEKDVRRQVHPKNIEIDIDSTDCAVVVSYVVDITYLDRYGQSVDTEKKKEKKKVKLGKHLKPSSNVPKVAAEVMKKCKYIHESKKEDLEKAIQELQHVMIRDEIRAKTKAEGDWWRVDEDTSRQQEQEEKPDMSRLEEYIELLYEGKDKDDMIQKTRGTANILALCSHVGNLEALVQDQTLMGALTRVLNEEYKKSVALCYNIMRAFLAFSNFVEMHPILANYRVGSITMKILELEVKRAQHREEESKKRQADYERDLKSGAAAETAEARKDRVREEARSKIQAKQQDKLLFVCFHVLINLAEDASTERKMVKRDLVQYLGSLLDRSSANLLYLLVAFLKKLSIFEENKDREKEAQVAAKVVKFVPCSCEPLTLMSLRLLYNLSFDPELREQMLKGGLIPRLVDLLKRPQYRARSLRLLYHMSMDDRSKGIFAYTPEAVPILMQLILNFPQKLLAKELAALAINLSLNERNAELMCAQRGLQHLMDRVVETRDPNLMKVVRNISQWTYGLHASLANPEREYRHRTLWSPSLEPLLELLTAAETESHDLLLEAMGTLSNLTHLDLPKGVGWAQVVSNYSLDSVLAKLLVPGMAQADVILEAVILLGALAHDAAAAALLGASTVLRCLPALWRDARGDAELRLQLLFAQWRLLMVKETREQLLYGTTAVSDMLEGLQSRHPATRALADQCLELVLEYDRSDSGGPGQLSETIKRQRWAAHNREWLQATSMDESPSQGDDGGARGGALLLSDSEDGNGGMSLSQLRGMNVLSPGTEDSASWNNGWH
ncbi:kinesin-associated protein [Tribonema minus]|uniref:Kinesin-associated protein n=1 Tax=Tribonema minus TaxID=303371 RepID=A0A836C6Y4_9STRA|nr:kinesin-associated protein [Tribonema minus]